MYTWLPYFLGGVLGAGICTTIISFIGNRWKCNPFLIYTIAILQALIWGKITFDMSGL